MLGDDAIERYARQIVIPGLGASGQEKLLASTALVVGDPRGCRTAALYLAAAGVRVVTSLDDGPVDVVAVVDPSRLDASMREQVTRLALPICWSAADSRGVRSGTHPAALPAAPLPGAAASGTAAEDAVLLDAAGCEVAALACRVLLGLTGANEARIEA